MDVMVRSYKSLEEEEEAILSAFRVFDKENTGNICIDTIYLYIWRRRRRLWRIWDCATFVCFCVCVFVYTPAKLTRMSVSVSVSVSVYSVKIDADVCVCLCVCVCVSRQN